MASSNADTYSHFLASQLFRELLLNMAMFSFWSFFYGIFSRGGCFSSLKYDGFEMGGFFIDVLSYAFL